MINKKNKTLEMYKKTGAEMRLLKTLYSKLITDISPLLYSKDIDKLLKISDDISRICCRADDYMFSDFPKISNDYTDVFYGSVSDTPRNDIDREIIELAKESADNLFSNNNLQKEQ